MTKQRSTTLDIYLAGYLECRGIPAEHKHQGTRVIVTFPQSDKLSLLLIALNENDPVPIIDCIDFDLEAENEVLCA